MRRGGRGEGEREREIGILTQCQNHYVRIMRFVLIRPSLDLP